ncbi:hypothetical protein QUV83_08225 [Cellulomonas cellasea]|uniref:hypothetical protein n=1 Tax=Cellulomonas cellasea TaxID=43670 RepID=UPI0025A36079|nr:hypothetical protein [Cellulomonas cellasea]MDM8084746.1 hypothetical protein [Cellulomonas cellasea]
MPRRMFVRVRDVDTRHEFDVYEDDPRIGTAFERVKSDRYPPAFMERRPKHHLTLAGQSAARSKPKPSGAGEATEKEN